MRAFVINLDRAPERWAHIEKSFSKSQLSLVRVPAIDGKKITLPDSNFNESWFRKFHGRKINICEVACYWSHLQAMRSFLETNDEHAFIAEDDIFLNPDFEELLPLLIAESDRWNVLRLSGLREEKMLEVKKLTNKYSLVLHLTRLKGAGAYLVDRKAAEAFVHRLLPMWLPWDHAIDREWFFGLKALAITPFPISQTEEKFRSAIQENSQPKLSALQRFMTTYPYQIYNEFCRWFFRGKNFLEQKM